MPDSDHARYLNLLTNLWLGSTLSDNEHVELNRLHLANQHRVNQITTEGVVK